MKFKITLSIFAVVYTLLFLIGPWHFYGELKHEAKRGIKLKDSLDGLVGAVWDNKKFIVCLKGRIDGEKGEIHVETKTETIYQQSIRDNKSNKFRNIVALSRNQYDKTCKLSRRDEFQLIKDFFALSRDYYHVGNVQKVLLGLKNGKYILFKLSRDQGVNRYNNYFGVYTKMDADEKLAWFSLEGVYHKKVNPSKFDYFIVLVKDFFTMPYQWVAMFIYASGGIG